MASLSALKDGIEALTDLLLDWQQEHDNTGRWPFGEIAACLGFGLGVVCSFIWLMAVTIPKQLPKWQLWLIMLVYVAVVVLASEWLKSKIRDARRARRRAVRRR